jgi:uncharacterized membrane protein YeiB
MYLGRLNWTDIKIQRKMFLIGLTLYLAITLIQFISQQFSISEELKLFINADYLPPFLPFILGTSGFSLMIISGFMYLGDKVGENKLAKSFASTGQMTLTHYVSHILIGMLLFSILNNNKSELVIQPVKPIYILLLSINYFVLSYYFSKQWVLYFKNGPLETLMRKVSD